MEWFIFDIIVLVIVFIILKKQLSKANDANDLKIVSKILVNEPNFDAEEFKKNAAKCIEDVYISYAKGEIDKLMRLESTELLNIHKSEIELGISNGSYETLFLKKINKIHFENYKTENNYCLITCKVWVATRKIKIDSSTFEVISYDELDTLHKMYFEFIKSMNFTSNKEFDYSLKKCPNCGANIEINAQGKCIYCNSILLNGEHSWVLNRINDLYNND